MNWQFTPYTIPCLITAIISWGVAYLAWRRRSTMGAVPLAFLAMAVAAWSLGYALELASANMAWSIFWAKVQYLGIVTTPVAWLAFALAYTDWRNQHNESILTRLTITLFSIVPLFTLALVWTNEWHGLVWSNIAYDTHGSFAVLDLSHGIGFWFFWVYAYFLLIVGTAVLIQHLIHSARFYRWHLVPMLLALAAPWLANLIYVFGLSPFPHLDLTPFAFALSDMAIGWEIFRRDLLNIAPIARDTIIEEMADGILVIDQMGRIVDINPAAQRMIGRADDHVLGQPIGLILATRIDLIERYRGVSEITDEIIDGSGATRRVVEIHIAPLSQSKQLTGRIIILRDITERKKTEEALKASAQYARSIIESSLDMIVTTDNERNIVEFNRAAEETFGYKKEEVIGKSVKMLYANADAGTAIRAALLKDGNYVGEALNQRKNGETFTSLLSATPLRGAQGEILGSVGISRDITERTLAEQALRIAEEKYRTIFESAVEGIFQSTPSGRFLTANPALARMWGYTSPQDLLTSISTISKQIYADPNVRSEFQKIMAEKGEVQGFEYQVRRKDGSLMWVSENAHAVRDTNGTVLYFEGTAEDITATKEAQQALSESESRFKSLFEESPISLWEEDFSLVVAYLEELKHTDIADLGTFLETHPDIVAQCANLIRLVDVNKATLKLYDAISKEQFLKNLDTILAEESFDVFVQELLAISEGKTHFASEALNRTRTGEKIHVLVSWLVAPGHERNYDQVLVSVKDISERKRNEDRLRESEALYHSLVEALPISLCRKDLEGHFVFANSRYCHDLGKALEDIVGKTDWDLHPAEFAEKFRQDDLRVMATGITLDQIEAHVPQNGNKTYVQAIKTPLRDAEENIIGVQILFWDVTERFKAEEQLRYLSTHDVLTGIYNRTFFEAEMARLVPSREFPVSIIVIDLDNMKTTNDLKGHAAGDELLTHTARILQTAFRSEDIIARIGGDEFAIILPTTDASIAEQAWTRIQNQVNLHNTEFPAIPVQLSIGIATAMNENLIDIFKLADARMYEHKRLRKGNPSQETEFRPASRHSSG